MKNFLCLLAIVVLGFTACEGPMGPMGPEGPPGPVNLVTKVYTVRAQDWVLIGGANNIGSYFEYIFDEAILTPDIYEYGTFIGYKFESIDGAEVQVGLPYTIYDIEEIDTGTDIEGRPFSIQYAFDVSPRKIAFKVVFSDFYTGDFAPPTCTFKVMYIW